MRILVAASCIALLAACSSPPKPPTVDGTSRQPINTSESAENIALRAQLLTAQARAQKPTSTPAKITPAVPASRVVTVFFPYNSAAFRPTSEQRNALLPYVQSAKRIQVRGRTDGPHPSGADEQIALERALAAKRYLVSLGVPSQVISVNYLSAGDFVAENQTKAGRA